MCALQDVIENQIYPPLSNGFSDENAYIRELTLKALLTLAPKMKQGTLTSNLLKHLSRLQVRHRAGGVYAWVQLRPHDTRRVAATIPCCVVSMSVAPASAWGLLAQYVSRCCCFGAFAITRTG